MSNESVPEGRKAVGLIIAMVTCLIPGLLWADRVGSANLWLAIAAIGGAVGGVLGVPRRAWYAGLVGGPVAGAGGMLLLACWASWRSGVYRSEAMLVIIIGALPGLALIKLLRAIGPDRSTELRR